MTTTPTPVVARLSSSAAAAPLVGVVHTEPAGLATLAVEARKGGWLVVAATLGPHVVRARPARRWATASRQLASLRAGLLVRQRDRAAGPLCSESATPAGWDCPHSSCCALLLARDAFLASVR